MNLWKSRVFDPYRGVLDALTAYWAAYGGVRAFLRSPFFHLSVFLTIVAWNLWTRPDWWSGPLSTLPSILGFSLGGFAIWLAWGDDKLRSTLAGKTFKVNEGGDLEASDEVSPYLEVSATFAHFVVVQVAALIYALVASSLYFSVDPSFVIASIFSASWFRALALIAAAFGFWIYVYSLMTILAAGLAIFRITTWYDESKTRERRKKKEMEVRRDRLPPD